MTTGLAYAYREGRSLLRVENVSLAFGAKQVLREVDAEIRDVIAAEGIRGQVVGFLGPSGIGKTQLCRILAGLQPPSGGRVLVDGQPVRAGMVGLVSQDYYVFPHRTVWANLLVAARQTQAPDPSGRARVMLDRFGLGAEATQYPAQLSGGQRQRVAIAQQLLCSEHFLLMDEPFSGLDPVMIDNVVRLIREVADSDDLNTIIVVTHDIGSAVSVADTLWLMGRDRREGCPVPGARLQQTYNLIDMGLAWRPNVRELPQFGPTVWEIRERFKQL